MSTASFSLSVQAPRIPSGLLFVIHSINVCCLWDLLFAVILCFFASFVCIRFDICHYSLPIHTASHTLLALYCACTCFAFASKWW